MVTFLFWTPTNANYVSKWWDILSKRNWLKPSPPALSIFKLWKWHGCTCFLGCFLFQPMAEPNRPNSWKWRCCCSFPYIFLGHSLQKKFSNVGHLAFSNLGHTNHCLSYYQSALSFNTSFARPLVHLFNLHVQ